MESFDTEELTDQELSQMLAAWSVSVPSQRLRTKIFAVTPIAPRQPSFQVSSVKEVAWYKSLVQSIGDLINPPKLPPLEITSKPVEVGTIRGAYSGRQSRNLGLGFLIQIAAVASIFMLIRPVRDAIKKPTDTTFVLLNSYRHKVPAAQKSGGGGGGGQRAATPAAQGAAPRFAPKQFMPPAVAVVNPKLAVVPTITAPAPEIQTANYDDPLSKLTGNSGGQGVNGFGDGKGGGIGNGRGDGLGEGEGGGAGGGIYRAGGDVSSPQLITKVEPEYSDQARKAKYSGVVHLSVVIDENGIPIDIRVTGPLGLGLDEKAVEAVQHWRFRPGLKNGKPVKVRASIEVSFRLL